MSETMYPEYYIFTIVTKALQLKQEYFFKWTLGLLGGGGGGDFLQALVRRKKLHAAQMK